MEGFRAPFRCYSRASRERLGGFVEARRPGSPRAFTRDHFTTPVAAALTVTPAPVLERGLQKLPSRPERLSHSSSFLCSRGPRCRCVCLGRPRGLQGPVPCPWHPDARFCHVRRAGGVASVCHGAVAHPYRRACPHTTRACSSMDVGSHQHQPYGDVAPHGVRVGTDLLRLVDQPLGRAVG